MSVEARVNHNGSAIAGISMSGSATVTAETGLPHSDVLPAAIAGTLSARVSASVGTLTLAEEHGVLEGDLLDVYWDGGRRYDVVAGVIDVNDVPISGGGGDDLPIATTAITAQVQRELTEPEWDGDVVTAIGLYCAARACVGFMAAGVRIWNVDLAAGSPLFWLDGHSVGTNPLAGQEITSVRMTQAGSSGTAVYKHGLLLDTVV